MRALLKTFFAMLVICFVSVQSVSAQQKDPCTDTDIPGETEGTGRYCWLAGAKESARF